MNPAEPPALAAWLLEHLRFSNTGDALAGDLFEEFARRRSAAWYWRQVLAAIFIGFASELRHHKLMAIRAIALSWAANFLALLLGRAVMSRLPFLNLAVHPALASLAISILGGLASGLLIACLYRRHRSAMLLTCAAALPGWALLAIVLVKKGAIQHSFLRIAAVAAIYYLVAVTGFVIGGFAPRLRHIEDKQVINN